MAVLFVASVVCLTFVIERWLALKREKVLPGRRLMELDNLSRERKATEVAALARASESPLARIVAAGLEKSDQPIAEIRGAMETAGRIEVAGLERNLHILSTLASVCPLIGLLGTVTGMIRTFGVVKAFGVGDPMRLSGGISEALLTTAGGLVVAIPAVIFYRHFAHRVDLYVLEMEEFAERVVGRLTGAK